MEVIDDLRAYVERVGLQVFTRMERKG